MQRRRHTFRLPAPEARKCNTICHRRVCGKPPRAASQRRRVYIFMHTVTIVARGTAIFSVFSLAHFLPPFFAWTVRCKFTLNYAPLKIRSNVLSNAERVVNTSMLATRVQQFNAVARLQLELQLICYRCQYDKQPNSAITCTYIWVDVLVACVDAGMSCVLQTTL